MDLHLTGKKALITGSSRGIGLAIAANLHAEGCHIVLNARNEVDLAAAVVSLPGAVSVVGDMTDPISAQSVVQRAVSKVGKLDILVCNVGGGCSVAPGEETAAEWQRVFALNLWSATNAIEAAKETLAASRGSIVCISSICGLEVIPGAPVTYSAAKAALHAYVRGVARPFGQQGIRINAVAPGNILFDGSVWSRKLSEDAPSVQDILRNNVALSKFGTPEDIARIVSYLASPVSSFTTAAVWNLDGGQLRS
jgi:NAD(P)-dependent dehydrogenase (short-subunit alcohol dehydrogenase family)